MFAREQKHMQLTCSRSRDLGGPSLGTAR